MSVKTNRITVDGPDIFVTGNTAHEAMNTIERLKAEEG
jgi:hypothetical protein